MMCYLYLLYNLHSKFLFKFSSSFFFLQWYSWLKNCATSWNVAGLIPNGVIGILHRRNPVGCPVTLGSTQPLTELSTTGIS